MILETLYQRNSDGSINQWTIEVEGNKYRTIHGKVDGKLITSLWTECQGKNIGRSNETTPEEQALSEAKSLAQKKRDKGYSEDILSVDVPKLIKPMLAKEFGPYRKKIDYPVFVQPKLDGIRCIATRNGGLFTRNGKEIKACPHISEQLEEVWQHLHPTVKALDGELYNDAYRDDFNKIVSLVRKTKPSTKDLKESAEKIQYWIYDLIWDLRDYAARKHSLDELSLKVSDKPQLVIIDTRISFSEESVMSHYRDFVYSGKEGAMVRLNGHYEYKRSKNLLKLKEFKDQEFKVLDIIEGEGNKTGIAASVACEGNGKTFNSNIKGDFTFLKNLLETKDRYIGGTCTVKFQDFTPDGIPRFPHVIKFGREQYE